MAADLANAQSQLGAAQAKLANLKGICGRAQAGADL